MVDYDQIENMKARGLHFLNIPDSYYQQLRERLKKSKVQVKEDLDRVCCLVVV